LGELQNVSEELEKRGIRLFAVTSEAPSEELTAFLAENQYSFPVYHDEEGLARLAFDNSATPRYFAVDHSGRIRFERGVPRDAIRELELLWTRGVRRWTEWK
jgi:hypothetical protein